MEPISAWTATSQLRLKEGKLLKEIALNDYKLKIISSEFCLWIVACWPSGGEISFRGAYATNDELEVELSEEGDDTIVNLKGSTVNIKVTITIPDKSKPVLKYTTLFTPVFDMLIPYWPRDIMPLFDDEGNTQNTKGSIHAAQVGTRSGQLFFSLDEPKTGSVFYFQNLSSLNKYCEDTETSAGDLVGGSWPEIGMKLPVTTKNKPLKAGEEYIVSDAYVLLSNDIPADNYQMSQQFLNYLADIYIMLPHPETEYHDWPDILHKGLNDLENHKGCWQFADGRSYLNAYVADYKTPPEIMVQLAVLLPLIDFDRWSGENHSPVIETLHNGLENFYDEELGTIVRWLPAKEKNLDWSEEQKKPDVMDSWYLHHPLLNLSRLALNGDEVAKKLLLNSIAYVIKVAHHFKYEWPVFYKMSTLEVEKAETQEGEGGEKDVPGAYAHLMIQVWQLTGDQKYFDEAVAAAQKLDGLSFDIFYQANNTAFSAGALLRLYKETKDELFLNLSYLCIASILKNVQLWDCNYGNAKHYPTFFAIYPLKDAPYTAAYEEQEVYAGIVTFLKEAEGLNILPSVKLLLAELVKYVINRVSYYYPPRLPKEVLVKNDEVKTGEIDPNLWIALEDLQDGWNPSGQVGQEVYGAGIAFGIVPRQFHKVNNAGFIVFTEYPISDFTVNDNKITLFAKGDECLSFRMAILPLTDDNKMEDVVVNYQANDKSTIKVTPIHNKKDYKEYKLTGNIFVEVQWK
jgi:hypothetical protein